MDNFFWLALVQLSGLAILHKYLSWQFSVPICVFVYVFSLYCFIKSKLPEIRWLVIVSVTIAFWGYLKIYPLADSGVIGGGSDSDDALYLGAKQILMGHYPYRLLTYLNNPITQLPGELILAFPFTFALKATLANWFWMAMFYLVVKKYYGELCANKAILLCVVSVPASIYSLMVGSDYLSNCFMVIVASLLAYNVDKSSRFCLSAILVGFAFASRPNYWVLLPLLFTSSVNPWAKRSFAWGGLICLLIVYVVWYISPLEFTPLHVIGKNTQFSKVLNPLPFYIVAGIIFTYGLIKVRSFKGAVLVAATVNLIVFSYGIFAETIQTKMLMVGYLNYYLLVVPMLVLGALIPLRKEVVE